MLFAPEAAAGIGGEDPHLGQRHGEQIRQRLLEEVRMLHGAPHLDPVAIRGRDEAMRLDGEVGDHGKVVLPLDHVVGSCLGGGDVTPTEVELAHDVRMGERVPGTQRWILDERSIAAKGGIDGVQPGQDLILDLHQGGSLLGRVLGIGGNGGNRLAVVFHLAVGEDRPVLVLRPEARHRVGEVLRSQDQSNPRHLLRFRGVDRDDPGPGLLDLHQFGLQLVGEVDIGDVLLGTGDPGDAPNPVG